MPASKVTVCENILDSQSWETFECDDVRKFLTEHFTEWPTTARIYHNAVAESSDVTPHNEAEVDRLGVLTGHFYIVVYPQGIETIFIIIAIVVAAVAIGLSFLLRPSTPNVKNQQETSPNNELANRQNKQRPNERIPDIFGRVRSIPDLLAVPYRVFEAGDEVEYAYYCIGRGSYTIHQVRDDITPYDQITGAQLEVYGPNTSPNSGSAPQLRIGAAIGALIKTIKPLTAINGQVLIAPNLAGAGFIGPFLMGDGLTTEAWFNFVAESGSYQIDSTTGVQTAVNTTIRVEITHVDGAGTPTGGAVTHDIVLNGDAVKKSRIGVTLKVVGLTGRVSIRAERLTNTTVAANTQVSDEIKWRDAMAVADISMTDFGNVTTVQTRTLPTPEALALKARNLNLLVTRNIPIGTLSGGVVTFGLPGPSENAADIIQAICTDSRIGNRPTSEIDTAGIYTTITAVASYFGTSLCTKFCFTFDDSKVSFEESLADVATAVFCLAYRRGSLITLSFEKKTANSTLLFNHRNKIPNSETRTVTFGRIDNIDGIEFDYIEPNDPDFPNVDTQLTLYFPADRSAVNAKKVTSVGIRNNVQAFLLASRLYNKLLNQNTVTQFEATQEAVNCVLQDRILVADNTRPDVQDGEVLSQNVLELELSQPVVFVGGRVYTIFLQMYDGSVESKIVLAGSAPNRVVIASATSLPLVVDIENFARTLYWIVDDTPQRATAFLVSEKTPQGPMTFQLKATNYSDAFYNNDLDFINNLIEYNGPEGDDGPPIVSGTTYHPSLTNDIGSSPTAALSNTTGDVTGQYDGSDPSNCFDGDCIWSGFPPVTLTTNVTLSVTASLQGHAGSALRAELILNGTTVASTLGALGSATYTVIIPAGTLLSSVTVEAIANGTGGGGAGFHTSEVDITDIHIL